MRLGIYIFLIDRRRTKQFPLLSIVLSRKVDYGVGWRFKFKRTLKFSVAPSPLNTLLENAPVLSEAP